ncbi:hypothetical protein [uncultured Dokdonia sp.]|uniref:hypothetical protein n=1 Tax=uncultured Dokdonia sp. TaxID=575653 RepID=UPI002607207B|nr:hypothetical protein [uncultured Dokdonia sp.]
MIVLYSTKNFFISTLFSILFFAPIVAQVGIGTTSPSAGSMLDITSADKGVLLPRVDIVDLSTVAPIVGGATVGLLVYNTNTTTGIGYYYWNGSEWSALSDASVNEDWELTGNSGTTPGTSSGENYIGTSDAQNLIIATNGTERLRVLSDGRVSINNTSPSTTNLLTVEAATNESAVNGFSTGTGIGVFGQNTSTGIAIFGNNSGGGDGLVGQTTSSGVSNGLFAVNFDVSGTAILGGNGSTTYAIPTSGSGVSASSGSLGLFAYAGDGSMDNANLGNAAAEFDLDADFDPTTSNGNNANRAFAKIAGFDNVSPDGALSAADSYYGGYFSGGPQTGNQTFAYVGMRYSTNNNGNNGTDYKIIGTGSVSTLIKDDQNMPRVMFAPEAPEIVFQDYGIGQLVNGEARITLDAILKKSLYINDAHPLKVYVTLEGECNGVYVTNKSIDGFTVKELKNGTSNAAFSWQIVANRADTKDANGQVVSKHEGLRLPIGPGYITPRPLKIKRPYKERE